MATFVIAKKSNFGTKRMRSRSRTSYLAKEEAKRTPKKRKMKCQVTELTKSPNIYKQTCFNPKSKNQPQKSNQPNKNHQSNFNRLYPPTHPYTTSLPAVLRLGSLSKRFTLMGSRASSIEAKTSRDPSAAKVAEVREGPMK